MARSKKTVGESNSHEGLIPIDSTDHSIDPNIEIYDQSDFNTDQITDLLAEVVEASTTELITVEHNVNEIVKANHALKATIDEASRIIADNEARKRLAQARQNAQVKFNQRLTDRAKGIAGNLKKSQ